MPKFSHARLLPCGEVNSNRTTRDQIYTSQSSADFRGLADLIRALFKTRYADANFNLILACENAPQYINWGKREQVEGHLCDCNARQTASRVLPALLCVICRFYPEKT